MPDDPDERVRRAQPADGGGDFRFAHGGIVVEQLALEIVRGDDIEVRDAKGADTGCGEIKCGGAAEAAGADHEHTGGDEFALTLDAKLTE